MFTATQWHASASYDTYVTKGRPGGDWELVSTQVPGHSAFAYTLRRAGTSHHGVRLSYGKPLALYDAIDLATCYLDSLFPADGIRRFI